MLENTHPENDGSTFITEMQDKLGANFYEIDSLLNRVYERVEDSMVELADRIIMETASVGDDEAIYNLADGNLSEITGTLAEIYLAMTEGEKQKLQVAARYYADKKSGLE